MCWCVAEEGASLAHSCRLKSPMFTVATSFKTIAALTFALEIASAMLFMQSPAEASACGILCKQSEVLSFYPQSLIIVWSWGRIPVFTSDISAGAILPLLLLFFLALSPPLGTQQFSPCFPTGCSLNNTPVAGRPRSLPPFKTH